MADMLFITTQSEVKEKKSVEREENLICKGEEENLKGKKRKTKSEFFDYLPLHVSLF